MSVGLAQVRFRGVTVNVPAIEVNGRTVIVSGRRLKIAKVRDEELVEGEIVPDPALVVREIKKHRFDADILTFPQTSYDAPPVYSYPFEWDNAAVVSTKSFQEWWESLPQESRKNARRAAKRGVIVRVAKFDDDFVRRIKEIYDETPVRQGMRFWHFGKDFDTVKMENATYLERSEFVGAYLGEELIGFIKFVYVDKSAVLMQILAKSRHYDKRPMNALLAKTVEVCEKKGMSYLVYSKFTFGNKKNSHLAEFKRRNGFQQKNFVRYFLPLTLKGRIALSLKLHRGLLGILPSGLIEFLLRVRAKWLAFSVRRRSKGAGASDHTKTQSTKHLAAGA
jgi:hypothetical protein